jgi:hypothetical protein
MGTLVLHDRHRTSFTDHESSIGLIGTVYLKPIHVGGCDLEVALSDNVLRR